MQLLGHKSHIIHSDMSSHIADSMAVIVCEIFSRPLSFDAGISRTMLMNNFHSYTVHVVQESIMSKT